MEAALLLADYASVSEGKLTIVGGGWEHRLAVPVPHGVAALARVAWTEAGDHSATFVLTDQDGVPFPPAPMQPVRVEVQFSITRPDWAAEGSAFNVPLAFNIGPMPFEAGRRYVWELMIDGESKPEWQVSFDVLDRLPSGPPQA